MVEFKVLLADAFAASSASFLAFFLAFFSAFLLAFSSSVSTDGVTAGVVVEDSLSFLFLSPSCFTGVAATGVSVFSLGFPYLSNKPCLIISFLTQALGPSPHFLG